MKKPLHKHIGHRIKRTHGHFTKYLYERDTIFATIWVFIFIVGLGAIPLNLGVLNPIKLSLKDFDFNDMSYSKLEKAKTSTLDSNIVLINIGDSDREGIAYLIDKTASYSPKVMGLDVLFGGPRDPTQDSLIAATLQKHKNLVVAAKYQLDSSGKLELSINHFASKTHNQGFVNFPNMDWETVRTFYPLKEDEWNKFNSFSLALLKLYNPKVAEKLGSKGDKKLIINYSRQIRGDHKQYRLLQAEDVLTDNFEPSYLKGKIALLAYITDNPNDIEDKKFTPMNDRFYGKTFPDMDGIVVHANIISMAMEDSYIKKVPLWLNILIAVLVCWLHMSFFVRYYLEDHIWFHLVAKIAQIASAIFFVWLGIYLFDRFRLKVDLKYCIVVIVLAVDVIYFYEAFAVWMHKKYNFRTIFHQKHHH